MLFRSHVRDRKREKQNVGKPIEKERYTDGERQIDTAEREREGGHQAREKAMPQSPSPLRGNPPIQTDKRPPQASLRPPYSVHLNHTELIIRGPDLT